MPDVIYYVAASLDGYIAPPDGSLDWLATFETAAEDYGYAAFYASIDAVLLGSRTYEQCLTFKDWPYPGKPCWVFSRRTLKATRPEVTLTAQNPRDVVSEAAARGHRRIWLIGGGQLAAAFRSDALITEYIISILPVILGDGIPLFDSSGPKENLKLGESTTYPNGVVQLRYSRITDGN